MKLIIDIPKEKYEWIKTHNLNIDNDSIVGAVANGTPYEERPQGQWIKKTDNVGFISHICSECGAEIELENPCDNKFCWNCGAQMKTRTDAD